MNVNCEGNENIYEATLTITFPCKQTIMKHDVNKFNVIQFECRIWNLINLLMNKKFDVFSCFCHSKYHKSITPPLQCDFLKMCTFSYGHLFLVSIFYQLTYAKKIKSTLVIWHIMSKPYSWLNFIWWKTWRAIEQIG